jgi:hypothetical protein
VGFRVEDVGLRVYGVGVCQHRHALAGEDVEEDGRLLLLAGRVLEFVGEGPASRRKSWRCGLPRAGKAGAIS